MNKTKETKKSEKTSFLSDMKVFIRAMKINYKIDPVFFWMQLINGMGGIIQDLFNGIITALVINGVHAGKDKNTLIFYALIAVFTNFIVNLSVLFTANRRYIRKSMWDKLLNLFFNSHSEKMDYAHFEDTAVRDRRRKIGRHIGDGRGIANFWTWYDFVKAIIFFVSSITVLSTMLLFTSDEHTSGILWFVNTPWAFLIFIAVMLVYSIYAEKYQKIETGFWDECDEFWTKNYRKMDKMERFARDTKRSMDMKIYGLSEVIDSCVNDYVKNDDEYYVGFSKKRWVFRTVYQLVYYMLNFFAYAFVGLKALSGAFGVGGIVLYVTTIMNFSNAFHRFGGAIGNIRGMRKAYDEDFAYIDMKNTMTSGKELPDLAKSSHTVEFRDVSFMYPGTTDYQLRHVNIKFGLGERIAVVGMNGSGKTTFIKLLCRMYDPTDGEIFVDGKNIREYDYKAYMKMFSVVFQDFKLFSLSVAENVAASRKYDAERVEKCLAKAGVYDRISEMPQGIETCIYKNFDENGVEISGGEAQKIAIARALYKDAPIMVLDEPTAALDPLAEAEVYSRFNEMVEGKIAVYISHRLSSCRFCSRIAVFDKGKLVEIGTHDKLLENTKGKYHELWHAQAQYYTND